MTRWRLGLATGVSAMLGVTAWAGREIGFSAPLLFENLDRAGRLLGDSWPPDLGYLPRLVDPFVETVQIALLGTACGALIAFPMAVLAARQVAAVRAIATADRLAMNVLRTMPDLFWAMLFASAVGFGPVAGALALTVFTAGVVSKLLSESIESIDTGPVEAVAAAGGSWLERMRYAVAPQILPHYVSYVLFSLELNVRASMILGLVGAGGIGMALEAQRTTFRYDRVTTIVLVVLVAVLVIEQLSDATRRRLA